MIKNAIVILLIFFDQTLGWNFYFRRIQRKNELLSQCRREQIADYVSNPRNDSFFLTAQSMVSSRHPLPNQITIGYTKYNFANGQKRNLFWISYDRFST